MLIQFAVQNFLSFRDKTILSLVASENQSHNEQICTTLDGRRLLRCAALYGANASGKSNLVKALKFAKDLVNEGTRPGARIKTHPFKLQDKLQNDTQFEFEIHAEGYHFSYGFSINEKEISAEWLYRSRDKIEQLCFERKASQGKNRAVKIQLGEIFGAETARVQFVADGTRPEQLFITEAEERNIAELKPISDWFREQLKIIAPESKFNALLWEIENTPNFADFLTSYMRSAGAGIVGLGVRRSSANALPESIRSELLESLKDSGMAALHPVDGLFVRGKEEGTLDHVRLFSQRALPSGQLIEFSMEEESDGTKRLLDLAPALFMLHDSKEASRPVFIIDELERSLHPLLTRRFLRDYLNSNCVGGQIILTTHDTNLLDLSLIRPDEIWFVEKSPAHDSQLYSLAEFKPKQLEKLGSHLEEGYLNGRFGAIPFFGKPVRPRKRTNSPRRRDVGRVH